MVSSQSVNIVNKKLKNMFLSHKYWQYFFPIFIYSLALSFGEFADGLIVSNFISSESLAIINIGMPIVMICGCLNCLFGVGGQILFSEYIGRRNEKLAQECFTISFFSALFSGLLILLFGSVFINPLVQLLCPTSEFGSELVDYIQWMLIAIPIISPSTVVFIFLPATGRPNLAMLMNLIAIIGNIIIDIVMIKFFDAGVIVAAYATPVAYILADLILFFCFRDIQLSFVKINWQTLKMLPEVFKRGLALALAHVGYSVKYAYCSYMATILGGVEGIISMSLCIQVIPMFSIVLTGANETVKPFLAYFRAQQDFNSVRYLYKKNFVLPLLISFFFTIILMVYPSAVTSFYNVSDPQVVAVAIHAIMIFSLCFVFRSFCMTFMMYCSIIEQIKYSVFISLFDGMLGIPLVGVILTSFLGLDGLWWTYPVNSILLVGIIFIVNKCLQRRYQERYCDILLNEKESGNVQSMDISVNQNEKSISELSQTAIDFALQKGVEKSNANKLGLLVEEMLVYIRQHSKNHDLLNLILKFNGREFVLDFRSFGKPFDIMAATSEDIEENLKLLRKIMPRYEYGYGLGMNSTMIFFDIKCLN